MTVADLGDVAEFINGFAFKESHWEDTGRPIIRIQNLNDARKPFNRTTLNVPRKYIVEPGDLLVSWSASLGVFEWDRPEPALVNQHIFKVVPNEALVKRDYLRHMLRGALIDMERHLHGATMRHINRAEFLATQIPLPPLPEQRRISAILEHAETVRAKRMTTLARLQELEHAAYQDTFGSKKGARVPFGQLVTGMRNGVSPSSEGTFMATVLTLLAVTRGSFDPAAARVAHFDREPSTAQRVHAEDFLICRGNGNLGLVGSGVPTEGDRPDLVFPDTVIAATVDRSLIDPLYLAATWRQSDVRRQIESSARTTSGIYKVNQRGLTNLIIPVPPKSLQTQYVSTARVIASRRKAMESSLGACDALLASLQTQAFAGRL